jgi:hypothetical protein
MSVAIQINNIDASANGDVFVEGTLSVSGSYVAGGDTVDFTGVNSTITKGVNFTGVADIIPSAQAPKQFWVGSQAGLIGYQYSPIIGSGPSNCKLKIGGTTWNSELSASSYPAALTGDTIAFQATFKKLQ